MHTVLYIIIIWEIFFFVSCLMVVRNILETSIFFFVPVLLIQLISFLLDFGFFTVVIDLG